MAKWSAFFPDMMAHLPGCPSMTVEHELRRAAIRFLRKSKAWKVLLDPIYITANQTEIEIELDDPSLMSLISVDAAWADGKKIDIHSVTDMDENYGTDWQTQTGSVTAFVQFTPGVLRPFPLPVSKTSVKMRVVVVPAESSIEIPDQMLKYRDEFVLGAMAKLKAYPNQPWTSPDDAIMAESQFRGAIDTANADAAKSFGRARLTSRPKWC